MSRTRLNGLLGLLAVLLATAAWLRWHRAVAGTYDASVLETMIPRLDFARGFDRDSLNRAARVTVAADPFRLANAPSPVTFASTLVPAPPPAAPVPAAAPVVRPTLVVRALIGGPPWSAILDGVPGQPPGLVVTQGASYGGLRIASIGSDTVVVQGPDTTWHLTMNGGAL